MIFGNKAMLQQLGEQLEISIQGTLSINVLGPYRWLSISVLTFVLPFASLSGIIFICEEFFFSPYLRIVPIMYTATSEWGLTHHRYLLLSRGYPLKCFQTLHTYSPPPQTSAHTQARAHTHTHHSTQNSVGE